MEFNSGVKKEAQHSACVYAVCCVLCVVGVCVMVVRDARGCVRVGVWRACVVRTSAALVE
eukprot:m.31224 g.31224  ORF g.31224 m.31224 type:complete len:60 (-) comp9688_c0_seq1:257-436(-)